MSNENDTVMFAEERKEKILQLLQEKNKILVPDLCKYFNLSPATIRNDLRELSSAGLLRRTHGGALLMEQTSHELTTSQKEVKNVAEKKAIAAYAASLIEDGDSIALDTGTTMMELAKLICQKNNLTVITNDLDIASYLENNSSIHIVLAGGAIRRGFHCCVGSITVRDILGFGVDKAFMAANGISGKTGLSTPDLNQAEVKKAMIGIALTTIAVIDSSKLGNVSFVNFAPIDSINRLIIDNKGDQDEIRLIADKGVNVVQIPVDS